MKLNPVSLHAENKFIKTFDGIMQLLYKISNIIVRICQKVLKIVYPYYSKKEKEIKAGS